MSMIPFCASSGLAQANRTRAERIATSDIPFSLFLARDMGISTRAFPIMLL